MKVRAIPELQAAGRERERERAQGTGALQQKVQPQHSSSGVLTPEPQAAAETCRHALRYCCAQHGPRVTVKQQR